MLFKESARFSKIEKDLSRLKDFDTHLIEALKDKLISREHMHWAGYTEQELFDIRLQIKSEIINPFDKKQILKYNLHQMSIGERKYFEFLMSIETIHYEVTVLIRNKHEISK